jgi:hypothetical protein
VCHWGTPSGCSWSAQPSGQYSGRWATGSAALAHTRSGVPHCRRYVPHCLVKSTPYPASNGSAVHPPACPCASFTSSVMLCPRLRPQAPHPAVTNVFVCVCAVVVHAWLRVTHRSRCPAAPPPPQTVLDAVTGQFPSGSVAADRRQDTTCPGPCRTHRGVSVAVSPASDDPCARLATAGAQQRRLERPQWRWWGRVSRGACVPWGSHRVPGWTRLAPVRGGHLGLESTLARARRAQWVVTNCNCPGGAPTSALYFTTCPAGPSPAGSWKILGADDVGCVIGLAQVCAAW